MIKNIVLIFCIILTGCKGNSQEKKQADKSTTSTKETYQVVKSKEEWKKELTDIQYYVLREAGTENAFTSDLLKENRQGTYVCAACSTPVFKSEHKFDSGTGWPSFDRAIDGNVTYDVDYKIGYKRTEEHCAVCGGHLGHVFEDGPRETTGKRHCINGAAMKFILAH
ncbi:peptide-methionine (R)-S-oxide reductase MsrB [Flavobacteriaceae bacterium KMM 6897]|nr:peptide-methionine (R)-S-oxide reductase MsrB [Flavobacteriaceae bacterium KMM 6897]